MRMGIGLGVGINRSNYAQGIFNAYSARVVADGGVVESGTCVDAVSSLLQSASLLLIPSGYKANKLYSEIPTNGNGDLTWARTSTANRTNASGNIELMATGVPRLSYMYGSCPSALLEAQRTNLALWSHDFDNAIWTKFNTSVTANTTTSPDGSSNADTMTGNGTTTQKGFFQSISITNGVTYTISIYAKKNTNNFLQIGGGDSFAITSFANFNLDTGVLGTIGATATATITNVGNGWYRCTMTASTIFGGSTSIAYRLINSSNSPSGESNTLSTSVFLYGAQLEAGAYQTTYIPTTSATATRVADSFSRSNIYTNGLISASGGTWFVELRNNIAMPRVSGYPTLYISSNTVGTSTLTLGFASNVSATRLVLYSWISGAFTSIGTLSTDNVKVAFAFTTTTLKVFVNGSVFASYTGLTIDPTTIQNLIGNSEVTMFIQQMALFNSALTDAQCQTLTT